MQPTPRVMARRRRREYGAAHDGDYSEYDNGDLPLPSHEARSGVDESSQHLGDYIDFHIIGKLRAGP